MVNNGLDFLVKDEQVSRLQFELAVYVTLQVNCIQFIHLINDGYTYDENGPYVNNQHLIKDGFTERANAFTVYMGLILGRFNDKWARVSFASLNLAGDQYIGHISQSSNWRLGTVGSVRYVGLQGDWPRVHVALPQKARLYSLYCIICHSVELRAHIIVPFPCLEYSLCVFPPRVCVYTYVRVMWWSELGIVITYMLQMYVYTCRPTSLCIK